MRYVSQSVFLVLGLFTGVYVALIIVFVIEKLDFLLHAAIEYNVSPGGFMLLLAAYMPMVADFILPVAALVSVYLVLVYKRENREFLILAAAGIGMRPAVVITTVLGGVFMAASLLVSGYIKPMASDRYHNEFQRAIDNAVISGPGSGQFVVETDTVVHIAKLKERGDRDIQIFQFNGGALAQVLLSPCARLTIQGGEVFANLCSLEVRSFGSSNPAGQTTSGAAAATGQPCRICPNPAGNLDVETLRAGGSSMKIRIGQLADAAGRSNRQSPLLHEMMASKDGAFVSKPQAGDAAKAVMMALSCLLAVAIAVVAAAGTNVATRFAMLPVSIAISTVVNVAASAGLLVPSFAFSPAGLGIFLVSAGFAAFLAIPLAIQLMRDRLLVPALSRS